MLETKSAMAKHVLAVIALLLATSVAAQTQVSARDEATRLVLRNGRATLVLDKARKGAVVSLTDNTSGQEFIAPQAAPCLFRLAFTQQGDTSGTTQTFSSQDADDVTYAVERTADGCVASLRFSGLGGRKIEALCTATLKQDDPLVRWRISVSSSEPLVLEQIHFPVLTLPATLGGRDDDDAVMAGLSTSGIFRRPGQWYRGARLHADQPGTLAAQFACYYDTTAGLYTATQDGKGYPKTLDIVRTADGLELVWTHLCYREIPSPVALDYDVVSTTFRARSGAAPTDWRDGADLYKQWATEQRWCAKTIADRPDIPAWVKTGSAILFCDLRSRWGNAESMAGTAAWIARYWPRHFGAAPPPTVILFACEGLAAWASPGHFPLYPSDEEFRRGAEALHKVGAHVYLAPSGYQWWLTYGKRPDGGFIWDGRKGFEEEARAHVATGRDGTPYRQASNWLEGGETTNLCQGDPWTREWFDRLAEGLHQRGGDIFHIDQVIGGHWPSGGMGNVCYSRSHGHPPGHGLWETEAIQDQLRSLRQKLPGFYIAGFEQTQELFLQDGCLNFYNGAAPWTSPKLPGNEPAPVIDYLYHEFAPLYAMLSGSLERIESVAYSIVNGNALLYGPAIHGLPGEPVLPNGGFEEWNDRRTPVYWQNLAMGLGQIWRYTGVVARDAAQKHGGESSLRLEGREGKEAVVQHTVCNPGMEMCDGRKYRLRTWLRSSGAVKGAVTVRATDVKHQPCGRWAIDLPGATDWSPEQIEFTLDVPLRRVEISLSTGGQEVTVWFDDIVLEELPVQGEARAAVWTETPQNRLLRQWVRLYSGAGQPYLVAGRMLRPPELITPKVPCSFSPAHKARFTRRVPLHFSDAQGRICHSEYLQIGENDVPEWAPRDLTFTVPEGAKRGTIYLYLQGQGRLWFDDLKLTEVGKDEDLLDNGAFESWDDASGLPSGWQSPESKPDVGVEKANRPRRDTDRRHDGESALCLVNDDDGDWTEANLALPVDGTVLSVGKRYRLSLWLTARGMSLWRRDPPLEIPAIFHNAFQAPDGSDAVVMVNITDQQQEGTLEWAGKKAALTLAPWELRLVRSGLDH